jgi:hypothetical protein
MRSIKKYGLIFIIVAFLLSVFAPAVAVANDGLPPMIPPPPETPPPGIGD